MVGCSDCSLCSGAGARSARDCDAAAVVLFPLAAVGATLVGCAAADAAPVVSDVDAGANTAGEMGCVNVGCAGLVTLAAAAPKRCLYEGCGGCAGAATAAIAAGLGADTLARELELAAGVP